MKKIDTSKDLLVGIVIILYRSDCINVDINTLPKNVIVIIVDNTPGQNLNIKSQNQIKYFSLGKNIGIAGAQNYGINIAYKLGCSHIIFFDQDSIIPKNYIEEIVDEYERILLKQPKLFLLGPLIYNGRDGLEYKSKIHTDIKTHYDFIPRREIISSGSCIAIEKIKDVGVLDNSLFIDFVDFEWCWRANAKGYQSGITPKISLTHFVGQQEYYFLKQLIIISSPTRYFYQTRNYIWLLKYNYVPTEWKINTGIKRILFSLTYPFKVKEWKSIYLNIWKGIIYGLRRKKD